MTEHLISLEGGGTRSQAVLMDFSGQVLASRNSSDVNTNFVSFERAQQAVLSAVRGVLQAADVPGESVHLFVSALVGPEFGADTFGELCPHTSYRYYGERDVVFARAGVYRPHGVAVVAATGATAWGVRADDGRHNAAGGWGTLLGDEGSAYATGLLGLRAAVRVFEGRDTTSTRLLDAICQHFGLTLATFDPGLVQLAYSKPLSRSEIADVAQVVTRLAAEGDPLAQRITNKVANDLAALALHVTRRLFTAQEAFVVAAAGGLFNAGELILAPLRRRLAEEFPQARLIVGSESPAIALGRLALYEIDQQAPDLHAHKPRHHLQRRAGDPG
jgi:N-acetylglucosamine kinase-like BadF-type ATPase